MQNILITGAAGFIGGKLFNYFKKKNLNVYGVDFNILNKEDERIFDINLLNYEESKNLLKRVKPHFIFHFAGFSGPERNEEKPELAYTYNVELLKNILKSLDNSITIFFPQTDKIFDGLTYPNESTLVNLTSVHAKVKFECENITKNIRTNILYSDSQLFILSEDMYQIQKWPGVVLLLIELLIKLN